MSTAIVWFRQDLRCQDNPALAAACANHDKLILIYVLEPEPVLPIGRAQQWWLHHSLQALKNQLSQVQLELHCLVGEPHQVLKKLATHFEVKDVYWNRCYEPQVIVRDKQIKSELTNIGIAVHSSNGSLLLEPWEVKNKSGQYFKVFTPYWRQCLQQLAIRPLVTIQHWPDNVSIPSDSLESLGLLPTKPNWATGFPSCWQPGESGAQDKLHRFIENALSGYKINRNNPADSGTSRLSPHLHFGEISPQQIWIAIQEAMQLPGSDLQSAQTFLSELGWREFSYHLLFHYPELGYKNFKNEFERFPWQSNLQALRCWQKGLTGFPIVDAGMRELWKTGYMHNRVRMIVASFLTKDLLIHWKEGADWFWDTLVDADYANNSASWQWVAGSGADAAPYYRIFNPVLQGEKFDPEGVYVKRWIPELSSVPKQWIHAPWLAPNGVLKLTLGKDYPFPIVDHAMARTSALESYRRLKSP